MATVMEVPTKTPFWSSNIKKKKIQKSPIIDRTCPLQHTWIEYWQKCLSAVQSACLLCRKCRWRLGKRKFERALLCIIPAHYGTRAWSTDKSGPPLCRNCRWILGKRIFKRALLSIQKMPLIYHTCPLRHTWMEYWQKWPSAVQKLPLNINL